MFPLAPIVLAALAIAALPFSADGFDAPSIRDTDYPIPAGALFVATSGNDGNSGSEQDPLRTIGTAIQSAAPGGTIVIRAGTYRTGDHSFSKPLTL